MIAPQQQPTSGCGDVPFNAAQWLAHYVELGGGYAIVGDDVWLHWLINGDVEEQLIRSHERVVRGDIERRNAVKALILERACREMVDG